MGNIYGEYLCGLKIIYGLVWRFFKEWANEIRTRKFVAQHLAPQSRVSSFCLVTRASFEFLVAVMNNGLLQLPPYSALSHVQYLVGLQLLQGFLH